jgi:hypothetical protein
MKHVMYCKKRKTKLRPGDFVIFNKLNQAISFTRGDYIILLESPSIFPRKPPVPNKYLPFHGGNNFEILVRVLAMATGLLIEEIESHPMDNVIAYRFKK